MSDCFVGLLGLGDSLSMIGFIAGNCAYCAMDLTASKTLLTWTSWIKWTIGARIMY